MTRLIMALLIMSFISCSTDKAGPNLLQTENLVEETFQVDHTKDTTLATKKGAMIWIKAGTFEKQTSVRIKEAYDLKDMILAGLTTQSGNNFLSSGGMIFLDVNGAVMKHPLKISIPTEKKVAGMQRYRGVEKNGKIDWIDPQPLKNGVSKTIRGIRINAGRKLFMQNCVNCHDPNINGTPIPSGDSVKFAQDIAAFSHAGDLSGLKYRGPWNDRKEVYKMVRNPTAYAAKSNYFRCLVNQYGYVMTPFPALKDADIDAILDYLEDVDAVKNNIDTTDKITACIDSCRVYDSILLVTENAIKKRTAIIKSAPERIEEKHTNPNPGGINPNRDNGGTIPKVQPERFKGLYYQFEIKSEGWYNVDMIAERAAKTIDANLVVNIPDKEATGINLYMVIPSLKVFVEGGKLQNSQEDFGFYTPDGGIKLPEGEQIIVFAITEGAEGVQFDFKEFRASESQRIGLDLKTMSKEDFNQVVQSWNFENLNIQAKDSKIAEELRKADGDKKRLETILESVRPKNCNCHCGDRIDNSLDEADLYMETLPSE